MLPSLAIAAWLFRFLIVEILCGGRPFNIAGVTSTEIKPRDVLQPMRSCRACLAMQESYWNR